HPLQQVHADHLHGHALCDPRDAAGRARRGLRPSRFASGAGRSGDRPVRTGRLWRDARREGNNTVYPGVDSICRLPSGFGRTARSPRAPDHPTGRLRRMTTSPTIHDLIIVGSGPAGYTAAIYAARAELAPLVFEGTQFGGELMTTTEVENFPGFKDGIMGPELMDQMREQALRFGADLRTEDVDEMDLTGAVKTVVANGETYRSHAVILAMGAEPRYLGVPGESQLLGRGVSACATCDGFFFRDQDIAVVGGGAPA